MHLEWAVAERGNIINKEISIVIISKFIEIQICRIFVYFAVSNYVTEETTVICH